MRLQKLTCRALLSITIKSVGDFIWICIHQALAEGPVEGYDVERWPFVPCRLHHWTSINRYTNEEETQGQMDAFIFARPLHRGLVP